MDKPHFLPYQIEWLEDQADIKIWEKSRRIGATYCQSWEDMEDALTKKWDVWFTSKDITAAREYIRYIRKWAKLLNVAADYLGEVVIDPKKDISAFRVQLPDDVTINALSSNPEQFHSKGGKAVWDEAARHEDQEEMWSAIEPITMWGGTIRILSTHNGKRVFYNLLEDIKRGKMEGSAHKTDLVEAVEQGLADKVLGHKTTPEERQAFIDRRKGRCRTEEQWLQQYMCTPVDSADSFLTYEMIAAIEDANVLWPEERVPDEVKGTLYLGMDIGRRKDLSVIWVDEVIGPMKFTRLVKDLDKVPFRIQSEILNSLLEHPQMRRACIDETGIGMQLAEDAKHKFGEFRVEPVYFTNNVKEELAYDLRTEVEERKCVIPASNAIREDFHSLRKSTTTAGNIRFDVASGADGHADYFWAKALANHASKGYGGEASVSSKGGRRAEDIMQGYR